MRRRHPGGNMKRGLDALDKALIGTLFDNGRLAASDIAARLGISTPTVRGRLRHLLASRRAAHRGAGQRLRDARAHDRHRRAQPRALQPRRDGRAHRGARRGQLGGGRHRPLRHHRRGRDHRRHERPVRVPERLAADAGRRPVERDVRRHEGQPQVDAPAAGHDRRPGRRPTATMPENGATLWRIGKSDGPSLSTSEGVELDFCYTATCRWGRAPPAPLASRLLEVARTTGGRR